MKKRRRRYLPGFLRLCAGHFCLRCQYRLHRRGQPVPKSVNGGATFNVIGGYQGNTRIHPDMQEFTIYPDDIWLTHGRWSRFHQRRVRYRRIPKGALRLPESGLPQRLERESGSGGAIIMAIRLFAPHSVRTVLRLGGEAPTGYQPRRKGVLTSGYHQLPGHPRGIVGRGPGAASIGSITLQSPIFAGSLQRIGVCSHCYNHIYHSTVPPVVEIGERGAVVYSGKGVRRRSRPPLLHFLKYPAVTLG